MERPEVYAYSGAMTTHIAPTIHAIIPAGGSGTRLWPLSRRNRPKFLLDLTGSGCSMLQETVTRLTPVSRSITVVTGARHRDAVAAQLHDECTILAEPAPRNSMAAIGWAAYSILRRFGQDAIVGSFAADHAIAHPDQLHQAIGRAVQAARSGYLTTIGIAPTSPSTAYGYIHPGPALGGASGAYTVSEFVEKPNESTARRYVTDGYLWNAGIFIVQAGTLRDALAHENPQMDRALNAIVDPDTDPNEREELWESIESIAIDYALAEPLAARGRVAVVPSQDLGWTDVGDYPSLNTFGQSERSVVRVDAPGTSVHSSTDQMIALVGVDNMTVVVQDDAILVVSNDRAQDVSHVVELARENGRLDMI